MCRPAASAACSTVWPGVNGHSSPSILKLGNGSLMSAPRGARPDRRGPSCAAPVPVRRRGRTRARRRATRGGARKPGGSAAACRATDCRRTRPGRSGWRGAAASLSSSMVFRSCSEPLPSRILSIRLRSSEVPTRHGVQKPQLSCAKKCAKCRATSNMSRLPSNTMNAPPVSMSSKAMRRSNSSWPMHDAGRPAACTAIVPVAPQSASTSRTVTPSGYS